MLINVNGFSIIILLGAFQGFYLSFILFTNRNGNYEANRYLALLLCAISASIFNIFLMQTGLLRIFYYVSKFPVSLTLLFGPFFYFYVRSLLFGASRLQPRDWFHFLPALIVFTRYIPYYFADKAIKNAFILTPVNFQSFRYEHYEYLAIFIFCQIHLWIYLFVIRRTQKQHRQRVKDYYSNMESRNLNWIQFFISLFALVYIVFILVCIILIKYNYMVSYNIVGITVSLSIFILGYRGLKQTAIITIPPLKTAKPESTELPGELIQSLAPQFNMLMNEEKLFTNPELNLDDLARRLGVPRNTVSQFINDYLKANFYDYINRLRVEEIKRLLLDADKEYLTIIALATEAGFNSKTSFNRIFRHYTGMTPSEYKRHHCFNKQKNLSGN